MRNEGGNWKASVGHVKRSVTMTENTELSSKFNIKITRYGPVSFRVEVDSPAGKGKGSFTLPFDKPTLDATLDSFRRDIKNTRDVSEEEIPKVLSAQALTPQQLGGGLFGAVFQDEIKDLYVTSLEQSRRERKPLPFTFEIHPNVEQLINLPWEYLFDASQGWRGAFFAFNAATPIIRQWPGQDPRPFSYDPPLRVLLVSAIPRGYYAGLGNLQREVKAVKSQLSALNQGEEFERVRVDHLEAASLPELGIIVRDPERTPHIIHFIGHGDVGSLLFEEEHTGEKKPVSEETLLIMLGNAPSLRLVVLNACRTAQSNMLETQLGVAQCLADTGIPAVVAMQFAISDDAAEIFAGEFYEVIAEGRSIDQAVTWGRIAIHRKFQESAIKEWGTPVLYLQTEDGHIFSDLIQKQGFLGPQATLPKTSAYATVITRDRRQADETARQIAYFRKLLKQRTENLRQLREQEALFGSIDVPLHLLNNIEKQEEEIARIKEQLQKLDPEAPPDIVTVHSGQAQPLSIRDQVTRMYDIGHSALQAEDWGEAARLLSRAQKLSPELPNIDEMAEQARQNWRKTPEGHSSYLTLDAQYDRARTHIDQKAWEDAAILLEAIVNTDAGYKDAYELSLETREKAEREKAEREKQQRLAELYQKAEASLAAEGWTGAIDYLTQIVEIEETYQDAAELLKEATRQRDMQEAYRQGRTFHKQKEWAKAVAAFGKVESVAKEDEYPDVLDLLRESRRQKQLDAWIQEAEDHISQGNWEAAIKILEANNVAAERGDGEVALHYAHARRHLDQGDWDQAAKNLQAVIKQRPNYHPDLEPMYQEAARKARLARLDREAVSFINQGNWSMAKTRLDQIIADESDYPSARQKLDEVEREIHLANRYEQARQMMALGQWAQAIPLWKEILSRRPKGYRDAQAKLGEAEEQLELATSYKEGVDAAGRAEWTQARDAFAKVADKDPNYRDVQTQLKNAQDKITLTQAFEQGIVALERGKAPYYNLGELERAVTLLQQAYDIHPRYQDADDRLREARREYTSLGHYLDGQKAFDQGDWEKSVEHWKKLVEEENQPDYHGDAAQKLAKAERQAHLHTLYQQAQAAQESEEWDQAAILLNRLLTEEPNFSNAETMLAKVKRQQQLLAAFDEAQQFMAGERWSEAIDRLKFIHQKHPTYRQAEVTRLQKQAEHNRYLEDTYNRGMAALRAEDWDAARRHFEEVFKTDQDYRDVETRLLQAQQQQTLRDHYQAGDAAANEEDWAMAIDHFIKIQEIDPDYRDARERLAEAQRQQHLATDYQQALEYLDAEQWTEAVPVLERISAQEKTYKEAVQKLAEAQKQITLAEKYVQAQAAMEEEVWAEAVSLLTEITTAESSYEKDAVALLETAQKEQRLDNLYKRAAVLREKKQSWEEALDLLEQVIAVDSDYREAIPWKFDLEEKVAQKREEERWATLDAIYNQAVGTLETDEESVWDEGIRRLEKLLGEEPEHKKAQQLLAQTRQRRADRFEELRRQAEEAEKKSDWTQAIAVLKRLKRMEPDNSSLLQKLQRAEQARSRKRRNRVLLAVGGAFGFMVICLLVGILGGGFAFLFGLTTPTATTPAQVPTTPVLQLADTPIPPEDGSDVALPPTSEPEAPTEATEPPIEVPAEEITEVPEPEKELTEVTEESVPTTPPAAPTNVEVVNSTKTSITLSWRNNADGQAKVVVRRNGVRIAELPANSRSYTDSDLACGDSFNYTVVAINEAGESKPAQITAQTMECPSPPPTGKIAVPVFDTRAGAYTVYIARAEDGWLPKPFFENGSQPAFSPDGQQIILRSWRRAAHGGCGQRLVLFPSLSTVDSDARRMTHNLEDAHPSLSRSGDIVFHSRRKGPPMLFVLGTWPGAEKDRENQAELVSGENPDWLGENRIIYYAHEPSSGLYVRNNVDGSIELVLEAQGPLMPAAAPDDDHVAVSLRRGGHWHVSVLSVSQGKNSLEQLTYESADDQLPVWSPDGQSIAFVSNREESWAVWVMNADGTNQRKLFDLDGPIDGTVSLAPDMSFGWGEERISWAP